MVNVIIVSVVSMLCYISAEMIYPLIPLYLTTILGTAPAFVGLIEGIANSFSALLKFYGEYYSDKKQKKKKILFLGYSGALINHLILIFANSWSFILIGKLTEKFCKAIRTAPRDAVVSENVENKSIAFGINETFNAFGATIGILIAYFLVYHFANINYKAICIISIIPIILSLVVLMFLKTDTDRGLLKNIDLKRLNKNLKIFLLITFFSSLGNSTKAILLLKAAAIGFSPSNVILLYLLINITNCVVAYPIGIISSKVKIKRLLVISYLSFALVYLGIGATSNNIIVILMFILYGFYMSFIAIGSRTFVSISSPLDMKATALGLCNSLVSFASLPATIISGMLWTIFGSSFSFYFSGIMGLLSAFAVVLFIKEP